MNHPSLVLFVEERSTKILLRVGNTSELGDGPVTDRPDCPASDG